MTPGQLQKLAFDHADTARRLRGEAERAPLHVHDTLLTTAEHHEAIARRYIHLANKAINHDS